MWKKFCGFEIRQIFLIVEDDVDGVIDDGVLVILIKWLNFTKLSSTRKAFQNEIRGGFEVFERVIGC